MDGSGSGVQLSGPNTDASMFLRQQLMVQLANCEKKEAGFQTSTRLGKVKTRIRNTTVNQLLGPVTLP